MTKNAAKFTFDTEFLPEGDRVAPTAKARQRRTMTNEELEAMAESARREGEFAASARAAEQLDRTIAALTLSLRAVLDTSHAQIEAVRAEAAEIALAMARKIAPAALARANALAALARASGPPAQAVPATATVLGALAMAIVLGALATATDLGALAMATAPGVPATETVRSSAVAAIGRIGPTAPIAPGSTTTTSTLATTSISTTTGTTGA